MSANYVIGDYMTPMPHVIGNDQTVAAALQRMHQLAIRHLPVVSGSKLLGIVHKRDLDAVGATHAGDPERLCVDELMTAIPHQVSPDASLTAVARTLAQRRADVALVCEDDQVVGIVTTSDLLELLADAVDHGGCRFPHDIAPSMVRKRILTEHKVLRGLLATTETLANRILEGDAESGVRLAWQTRELYQTLLRHMDVEDRILAPALQETDAFGKKRAENLLQDHREQRRQLRQALATLDDFAGEQLARSVLAIIPLIRSDMQHEERDLLSEELLKDDVVTVRFTG